jgi:hypothetical protein
MKESHGGGVATHTGPESIRRITGGNNELPPACRQLGLAECSTWHGRPPSPAVLTVLDDEKLSPSDDQVSDRDQQ